MWGGTALERFLCATTAVGLGSSNEIKDLSLSLSLCLKGSVCITKTEKAESEVQRGKPKGTLESEIRNAIS